MKKYVMLFGLAVLFILSTASLTTAAVVYEQLPGAWGAFNINWHEHADDFILDQTTNISGISWWGTDNYGPYLVTIYKHGTDGKPGDVLTSYTGALSGVADSDNDNRLKFTAPIMFTAKAGVKYWLSVQDENADWNGWYPSGSPEVLYFDEHWVKDYSYPDWGHDPAYGDYHRDLSFSLQGDALVPVPAAVWLLGSGLIGLLSLRKKFK